MESRKEDDRLNNNSRLFVLELYTEKHFKLNGYGEELRSSLFNLKNWGPENVMVRRTELGRRLKGIDFCEMPLNQEEEELKEELDVAR